MFKFKHKIQYYETDRMGITHHSNYIRFMEEGRTAYLEENGCAYDKLEKMGVVSPVLSVNCDYKASTTYGDTLAISVAVTKYNGIILEFSYVMEKEDGTVACVASSSHCFVSGGGAPVIVKRAYPELHEKLLALVTK